jgi:hypothetical protein
MRTLEYNTIVRLESLRDCNLDSNGLDLDFSILIISCFSKKCALHSAKSKTVRVSVWVCVCVCVCVCDTVWVCVCVCVCVCEAGSLNHIVQGSLVLTVLRSVNRVPWLLLLS